MGCEISFWSCEASSSEARRETSGDPGEDAEVALEAGGELLRVREEVDDPHEAALGRRDPVVEDEALGR